MIGPRQDRHGRAEEVLPGPLEFAAYGVPGKAPSAWVNRNWAGAAEADRLCVNHTRAPCPSLLRPASPAHPN